MCGTVLEADRLPATPEEALRVATGFLGDEAGGEIASPGGRIELVNWDPARNVVFRW